MSRQYKLICSDCKEYVEAADREILASFIANHQGHDVEIMSEYDELFQYKEFYDILIR